MSNALGSNLHKANLIKLYEVATAKGWTRSTNFYQNSWASCLGSYAAEHGIGGLKLSGGVSGTCPSLYKASSAVIHSQYRQDAIREVFGNHAVSYLFNNSTFAEYSFNQMVKQLSRYIQSNYDWTPPQAESNRPKSKADISLLETHVTKLRKDADKLDALVGQLQKLGFNVTDVKIDGNSFTFKTTLKD